MLGLAFDGELVRWLVPAHTLQKLSETRQGPSEAGCVCGFIDMTRDEERHV